ncbi:N-methyl-L-tryptophan oxidase [Novosphingobium sp. Gsoil 351]|uniref:N-methyl-L-tryptophan oxidase n=1 Tax=Novosphingobium sp. Gsoil 351 TaxID=2675225 RepID=UPI001E50CFAF|nr:N-methyl-L-tryptophan oxidase [Novosphingobium sp. Gsoil 351]
MGRVCDVAVIGLGAVGSSALYQLAKRGIEAVGIDRFAPPHDRGSSHGESRITRQAIGEGEAYVPLVLRSNAIWEELESVTGERLLERCGFLFMTRDDAGTSHHGHAGFLRRTRDAAERFKIDHEVLDAAEIGARFPQFIGLAGDETGYYEPGGGYLRPERCIAASLSEARRAGARIVTGMRVCAIERGADQVRIRTEREEVVARHAIVATGPWLPQLAKPEIGRHVAIRRQVLHWFPVHDISAYRAGLTPSFIWTHGLDSAEQFYGFPPIDGLVKVAREDDAGDFDIEQASREADFDEGPAMAARHVTRHLAGLAALPSKSAVCPYAVTPDTDFLISSEEGATVVSACSGHGFKHAAAVGEAAAALSIGELSSLDLPQFGPGRFNT